MSDGRMLFYVVLAVCLMGAFAILLRITQERNRLVGRYNHIKKLLEYRETMRIQMERKNQEVAAKEEFINSKPAKADLPADGDIATVQPVDES